MQKVPNLKNPSEGKYKYRKGVPETLQDYIGQKEWKHTLDTDDENHAVAWAKGLNKKYNKEVREARQAMKKKSSTGVPAPKKPTSKPFDLSSIESEIQQLSENLECKKNADLNTLRLQLGNIRSSMQYAVEKDLSEQALAGVDLRPVSQQTLLELCTHVAQVEKLDDGDLRRKTARFVIQKLQPLLEEMEDSIPPLMGQPVPVRTTHKLIDGRWEDVPVEKPAVATTSSNNANGGKIPTLSEAFEKHIAFRDGNVKDDTPNTKRAGVDLFIEWADDRPVSDYSPDDLVDYRNNCLRKYPKNRQQRSEFDGKSLADVLKIGANDKHIGRSRIDTLISNVSSVFRFSVQRGWITLNPASGLKEPKPKVLSEEVDKAFEKHELKKLFEILPYKKDKPSWYWSVMISLYNGCRQSEICQLFVDDIITHQNLPCFNLTEEGEVGAGKSLKNRQSWRKIPINPTLIEMGFMRFVEARRKELNGKKGLLFSNVHRTKDGKYNKSVSSWFRDRFRHKFVDQEIQAVRRRTFHGLRHSFAHYSQNNAKMDFQVRHELMGHELKVVNPVNAGYTGKLPMARLLEDLVKVDYADYDLTIPPNPFMKKKATK
jgi:integrase